MTSRIQTARREAQRFLRFLAVGAVGFVFDTGTLTLLAFATSMDRRLAKGIAFCVAVASNFVLNRYWTYRESRSKRVMTQMSQFMLTSVVGLGINVAVFGAVEHALAGKLDAVLVLYVAQACAVGTALVWNFGSNRFLTYGDVKLGH